MPRYTFAYSDLPVAVEPIVAELSDGEAARTEAVRAAGELLRDAAARFWHHPEWEVLVTDEAGAVVCRLRMRGTLGRP